VQEIVGALRFYNADEGWVVTNSIFTPSARSLARANNIRLIDGHDLKDFAALKQKP
jgi:restriction system protein